MVKCLRAGDTTPNECVKTKYLKPKANVIKFYTFKDGWKDG